MLRVKRTERVKLADIKANLFVRKELDTEHVMYLADLIEGGVEMKDRIRLNEDMVIIDGRHRKEAYELCRVKEVDVDIVGVTNETDIIAEAYRANAGGSKPPTPADTEHTIMLLLDRNESMRRIGELLGLPASMARKYATEVRSRMNRAKLQRAASAVTDGGMTVAKAAEMHEVDLDKLKELLSGYRKKNKHGVQELQRVLTQTYKSVGLKNAAAIRRVMEKWEDGDVTEKQVRDIFRHLESLQKGSAKAVADWKVRFEAVRGAKKSEEKLAKTA